MSMGDFEPLSRTTTLDSLDGPKFGRQDTFRETRLLFDQTTVRYLLSFVPMGVLAGLLGLPAMLVFWLNFMALIPLSSLVIIAVLKLSSDWSAMGGGLLRAVLGNTAEMTICIVAMLHGEIKLVQSTIIGSVVAYSLLTLGGSLFVASYDKTAVSFSKTQTSVLTSLVLVVTISLIIPTVMALDIDIKPRDELNHALLLSRGTAIILLILFATFMFFRFHTHEKIFSRGAQHPHPGALRRRTTDLNIAGSFSISGKSGLIVLLYIAATAGIAICSRYVIISNHSVAKTMGLTRSFFGLIILPAGGHAAKSTVIVMTSRRRKLDSAIRAIMINVLDTLLFITPCLILFGWFAGLPMQLEFDLFDAVLFLLGMVVLTNLLSHGKTTYFEGIMLIGTYVVIAASLYVYPEAPQLIDQPVFEMLNATLGQISG